MQTRILAGFLGSGKTTVLMELAGYLTKRGKRVVILENEISSAAVDDQLLESRGFQVRTIFAGCVCCSSSGALCEDVRKIQRECDLDWLILEATGLAYPDAIQSRLREELGIDAKIITLVDAKRWKRVLAGLHQFAVCQLQGANAMLVTKIDTVETETLQEVLQSISELTGQIPVHPVCAIEPISETIWKSIL